MNKKFIKKVSNKLRTSGKDSGNGRNGGIKKQYLKSRPVCKVTFNLPEVAAPGAKRVNIVGDFNNWDLRSTLMKRLQNGDFTATIELAKGREYRFRYLIENAKWENDWQADKYLPNPYGGNDSVVIV